MLELVMLRDGHRIGGVELTDDRVRVDYLKVILQGARLFSQKQDERGPNNVNRMGASGLLSSIEERIERVRAGMLRETGPQDPTEFVFNLLDLHVFPVILHLFLHGAWPENAGQEAPEPDKLTDVSLEKLARDVGNLKGEIRRVLDKVKALEVRLD